MRYYLPIDIDEHMLFAHEIAAKFDLQTESGNLHSQFVRAAIYETNPTLRTLYYETRHGLKQVYPSQAIIKAMLWIYSSYTKNNAPGLYYININARMYRVQIGKDFFTIINHLIDEFREDKK